MRAGKPLRYVICYDIPDDRRRQAVARCLEGYGQRVQYSVFELVLDTTIFDNLVNVLVRLIDPSEDKVSFYLRCAACSRRSRFLGVAADEPRPGDEIVFIV